MSPKISNPLVRLLKTGYGTLSSKPFLIWLSGGWIVYYAIISIWSSESFGNFVIGLQKSVSIRVPFLLFLASGYLNIIRSSLARRKKGGLQFIAWLLLPLGVMLFLSGFYISITTRQFEWLRVGKGHVMKPSFSPESYLIDDINPGISERLSGKGGGNAVFAYAPKVAVRDKASNRYEAGAFPALKIDGFYVHILGFGLAPGIAVFEGDVKKDEGYMPLKIILPGDSDYFDVPNYPYRVLLTLGPGTSAGKAAGQFDLRRPTYGLKVFKGERVLKETTSGDSVRIDDLTIAFIEPTFWVMLEVVKDRGLPVILSGLLLMAVGIPACLPGFLLRAKR